MVQVPAGYDEAAWRAELQPPEQRPVLEGQVLVQPDGSLGACCPDKQVSACSLGLMHALAPGMRVLEPGSQSRHSSGPLLRTSGP